MKTTLALLLTMLAVSPAFARKAGSDLTALSEHADLVAIGKVVSIDVVGSHSFAVMRVTEMLRGEPRSSLTFYAARRSLCDTTFVELGDEVLVFLEPADAELREALRDARREKQAEPLSIVANLGTGLFRFAPKMMARVDWSFIAPKSWSLVPGPELKRPDGQMTPGPELVALKTLLSAVRRCVSDLNRCSEP